MGGRPRYSSQDKREYIHVCGLYNAAQKAQSWKEFIVLSIRLHVLKGKVPVKWRRPAFVRAIGGA
jgi:hypothetical protein